MRSGICFLQPQISVLLFYRDFLGSRGGFPGTSPGSSGRPATLVFRGGVGVRSGVPPGAPLKCGRQKSTGLVLVSVALLVKLTPGRIRQAHVSHWGVRDFYGVTVFEPVDGPDPARRVPHRFWPNL